MVVFASQKTARQRGPDGRAEADFRVKARVLLFDPFSDQEAVLGLLHGGRNKVELSGHSIGLHNLPARSIRLYPSKGLFLER